MTRGMSPNANLNQPEPRSERDLWQGDEALRGIVTDGGGDQVALAAFARHLGSSEVLHQAEECRRDRPRLVTHDRAGRRVDAVHFNDSYHRIMALAAEHGYAAVAWSGTPGGHLTHAAMVYLLSQVEPGICCPMTMTYAAVPALRVEPALEAVWLPKLTARAYEPRALPIQAKAAATMGMAMTELQGGSDLRTNETQAEPVAGGYRLTGHKWFCSAPMSDGFLTLAQAPGGLTCFLMPRHLEQECNEIRLLRLKDKLGNHANASAEIALEGAFAHRLGEEGSGIRTIIEMVHHTRLDTAMAPAGLMRAALVEAKWWADRRTAFQHRLVDLPLMRAVLADLALDWEAALVLAAVAARAFDGQSDEDRAFARLSVALAKYLNNKRCPNLVYEAMEVMGGMGYVEETPMPMLYREAPLNSIWEGSGNVICLDVLRTLERVPLAGEVLRRRLEQAKGVDRHYDAALARHNARWPGLPDEAEARWFTETLSTLLAAAELLQHAPAAVADAFCATRLAGDRGLTAGAIARLDAAAILNRIG